MSSRLIGKDSKGEKDGPACFVPRPGRGLLFQQSEYSCVPQKQLQARLREVISLYELEEEMTLPGTGESLPSMPGEFATI